MIFPCLPVNAQRQFPTYLEIAGFRIEAVRWMEGVNKLPSTRTKRYVVVARKHA